MLFVCNIIYFYIFLVINCLDIHLMVVLGLVVECMDIQDLQLVEDLEVAGKYSFKIYYIILINFQI